MLFFLSRENESALAIQRFRNSTELNVLDGTFGEQTIVRLE